MDREAGRNRVDERAETGTSARPSDRDLLQEKPEPYAAYQHGRRVEQVFHGRIKAAKLLTG
jgi:hypothetical protein